MKVLGTARSSRVSTPNTVRRGRTLVRRPDDRESPSERANRKAARIDRNDMIVSFASVVCDRMTAALSGADRAPGRCRAGGGLLGGKDLTGRFFSGVRDQQNKSCTSDAYFFCPMTLSHC